jgi:hypothetical protein
MTAPRFFSVAAMIAVAATVLGFGAAYREVQQRERLSIELTAWQLEEWKDNLLEERQREFFERSGR